MTEYIGTSLKNELNIKKLYTVHYFEFSKKYKFFGEKHNFWEFVYIDKGQAVITAEDKDILISEGNVIFHKPNEWHNISAGGKEALNIAIVSFSCDSPIMSFFENKILAAGQEQKYLISKIITEYTNAFSSPLDNPFTSQLIKKSDPVIGSQQLLRQYLCEFLLTFLRDAPSGQHSLFNINHQDSLINLLTNYMHKNICRNITIGELIKFSGSNKTTITQIFNKSYGVSPIEYFIGLKIELAKKYLREDNYNVTQISELLGYSGIHYFSRQFKKFTGMSPTQYSKSIQAILNQSADS